VSVGNVLRSCHRSSAGFAGAIDGGRSGRGAQPPSGEIECHAHRHKEVTL